MDASIIYDYGQCIHVEVKGARSARSAAASAVHVARKRYGSSVVMVSSGGTCHEDSTDYRYVFAPAER